MTRLKARPKSSLILWVMIIGMMALIVVSIFVRRKEPMAEVPPERAYPVELLTLVPENLEDVLLLPGRIEPALRARLPADKPGRVTDILVDRGDTVTNRQVLLRLDARLWEAMLSATEVEVREAEKEFNRWRELEDAGAVSSSDMDQIRTRLDRARIQRDEAVTHVSQCEVRSPADGIINDRYVEVGEHATEGMAVFELVTTDPVKIRVDVPERDALPLAETAEAVFTVSVLSDQLFTGRVTFAAAAAQPVNNAFRMEVEVGNQGQILKPGMIAEVRYQRGQLHNALSVPLDAIIPRRGEYFVYVADHDRAVRRMVRIDRIVNSRAVISEGLQAGDRIVVRGNRALADGVLLSPVEKAEVVNQP